MRIYLDVKTILLAIPMLTTAVTWSSDAVFADQNSNNSVCEAHIAVASKKYGVPLAVLYAVGLTESGKNGYLHPYALNLEGRSEFPASVEEALGALHTARGGGMRLIDVGCMQINHHYHRSQFSDDRAMFDPASNVMYAANFLKDLKNRHKTWEMALARYHAGPNNNTAQKRYVCHVIRQMVASKTGGWTPEARRFCQ